MQERRDAFSERGREFQITEPMHIYGSVFSVSGVPVELHKEPCPLYTVFVREEPEAHSLDKTNS